jgi:hypothetical protein
MLTEVSVSPALSRWGYSLAALAGAGLVAACADSSAPTAAATAPRFAVQTPTTTTATPEIEFLKVCKQYPAGVTGPDITVRLDVSGTAEAGTYAGISIPANQCMKIWEHKALGVETIVVTEENPPAGYDASVATWQLGGTLSASVPGTSASVVVGTGGKGATVIFTNTPVTPPEVTGSQGCTPGYWKQSQHFGSWDATAYGRSDLVNTVFGITFSPKVPKGQGTFDGTLLGALGLGGGNDIALVRAGTAALLNASSTDVAYPYTSAQVIKTVQDALAAGGNAIGTAANLLDSANNLGCPLGRNP